MIIVPETTVKETIELLLQRGSDESEKLCLSDIVEAENRLQIQLPPSLKELYLHCGNNQALMNSHNHFISPKQLVLVDNHLVFIKENQGVCWWGVEIDKTESIVYMQTEEDGEWYSEEINISQFITLSLYFQCAMAGYNYCGIVHLSQNKLFPLLEKEWKKAVNHNGLVIYSKAPCLIWYFTDNDSNICEDSIYFSSLTLNSYKEHFEKYDLDEI